MCELGVFWRAGCPEGCELGIFGRAGCPEGGELGIFSRVGCPKGCELGWAYATEQGVQKGVNWVGRLQQSKVSRRV